MVTDLSWCSCRTRPRTYPPGSGTRSWRGSRTRVCSTSIGIAGERRARDDVKSHALLKPPSELPKRLATLLESIPTPPVQHSLVGLIRNLTVNPANRPLLGAPVVDGILALDPWQPARDSLDRLQRDAMIALSNLSSDPALAERVIASEPSVSSLIALVQRPLWAGSRALARAASRRSSPTSRRGGGEGVGQRRVHAGPDGAGAARCGRVASPCSSSPR